MTNTWSSRGTSLGTLPSLAKAGLTRVVARRLAAKAFVFILKLICFSFLPIKLYCDARAHMQPPAKTKGALRFHGGCWTTGRGLTGIALRQEIRFCYNRVKSHLTCTKTVRDLWRLRSTAQLPRVPGTGFIVHRKRPL